MRRDVELGFTSTLTINKRITHAYFNGPLRVYDPFSDSVIKPTVMIPYSTVYFFWDGRSVGVRQADEALFEPLYPTYDYKVYGDSVFDSSGTLVDTIWYCISQVTGLEPSDFENITLPPMGGFRMSKLEDVGLQTLVDRISESIEEFERRLEEERRKAEKQRRLAQLEAKAQEIPNAVFRNMYREKVFGDDE